MSSAIVREIQAKSILSASKIYPYVINPHVGCQHACSYCYARYMKRFTGHTEPWGRFVDVKVNAATLLQKEICKKRKATVWISGVCDPYQPLERKYRQTRQCLQILARNDWPAAPPIPERKHPMSLDRLDMILRTIRLVPDGTGERCALALPDKDRPVFAAAHRCKATHFLRRSNLSSSYR